MYRLPPKVVLISLELSRPYVTASLTLPWPRRCLALYHTFTATSSVYVYTNQGEMVTYRLEYILMSCLLSSVLVMKE